MKDDAYRHREEQEEEKSSIQMVVRSKFFNIIIHPSKYTSIINKNIQEKRRPESLVIDETIDQ